MAAGAAEGLLDGGGEADDVVVVDDHAEAVVAAGGDLLADVAEADHTEDVAAQVAGVGGGLLVAGGEVCRVVGLGCVDAPGELAEGGDDHGDGEVCHCLGGRQA